MIEDNKGFDPKYDDNKKSDIIYIGKDNEKSNGSSYRKIEVIVDQEKSYLSDKNKEICSTPVKFSVKEDVILFCSSGGQQKIHCWLVESDGQKSITAIHISRRTEKGVYGSQEITLTVDGIIALKKYLDNLISIDTSNKSLNKIALSELDCSVSSSFAQIISDEEFTKLIKANIKNTDDFYKLLTLQKMNLSVDRLEEIINGVYTNEVEIQKFLSNNIWMFGNDYVFIVKENKIDTNNILDLIPKNIESYVDIIEVKLPNEKLFNFDNGHNNFYATSNLTKAIAQTQNYIFEMENKAQDDKYQKMNNCRIIKPRGIILFGSKQMLSDDEKKYLRVLNSSFHNLQIITYQQLLEKARNTIDFSKHMPENAQK